MNTQELIEAYKADLRIDIECALRDGLPGYADKVRRELAALTQAERVRIDKHGCPQPTE